MALTPGSVRATSDAERVLFTLVDEYDRAYQTAAKSVSLTPAQACVLGRLDEPRGMKGLASDLGCDASNVTQIARRLEQLGLAERMVDPLDGRARALSRTSRGDDTYAQFEEAFRFAHAALRRLTSNERTQLTALIRKALEL